MLDVAVSIVVFRNDENVLRKAIESVRRSTLKTFVCVVDNSPDDRLKNICHGEGVEHIYNGKNVGFGAGHNIALKKMTGWAKYALVLNPDVYFEAGTLEKLFYFMNQHADVGLVMPKILYPDGSLQYACRLLPDPLDMMIRKANNKTIDNMFRNKRIRYEFQFSDYAQQMDVPYLSGCFMFIRESVFATVGMFDERFFLYFEDIDLSRRIHRSFRTVYYPQAVAYHGYQRSSYKDIGLLRHHIISGIQYFNKWGWFFDRERKIVNNRAVKNVLRTS